VLFLVSLVGGCTNVGPLATPSGNPEVTIATNDVARVKNALMVAMSSRGFSPVQDTQYVLSFTRKADNATAMLYEVALGSVYSNWPTNERHLHHYAARANNARICLYQYFDE
jgi:hypothetical protein